MPDPRPRGAEARNPKSEWSIKPRRAFAPGLTTRATRNDRLSLTAGNPRPAREIRQVEEVTVGADGFPVR
jgi:hypothetical protein